MSFPQVTSVYVHVRTVIGLLLGCWEITSRHSSLCLNGWLRGYWLFVFLLFLGIWTYSLDVFVFVFFLFFQQFSLVLRGTIQVYLIVQNMLIQQPLSFEVKFASPRFQGSHTPPHFLPIFRAVALSRPWYFPERLLFVNIGKLLHYMVITVSLVGLWLIFDLLL